MMGREKRSCAGRSSSGSSGIQYVEGDPPAVMMMS
jgi:hypothetical protein